MISLKDRIHSPVVRYIISSAITIILCATLMIMAMMLRRDNANVKAKAEQYQAECVAQSERNDELGEMLKPEHESELLSRAALENGYVNSEDFIFKNKN
ncbi:MAG: hypothetical protein K6G90_14395 [Clostridia bacterium]|nr:hypothetical protein [Clostridia bacterium]